MSLQRLKVRVTGGGNLGQSSYSINTATVIENLSRSWLVERSQRGNRQRKLIARELRKQEREEKEADKTGFLV